MTPSSNDTPRKDWVSILFLTLTPILGIPVLIWYTWQFGIHLWMPILFGVMFTLTGLSICAGYHRYYSHKSYECARIVQLFYAIFGAMAVQNSILEWCAGHRRHHAFAESEWDPYSIRRGFWWAHIIWIFQKNPGVFSYDNVRDLQKDPIVAWQHRWYKPIGFAAGFGIPLFVGWCFGNPIAGLLWGGFLRIALIHHSTFSVNSLAHRFGSRSYDDDSTARDNWIVALVTFGEGYHSFHHRFPADFRNGIRWYNWDPAKWFINALKFLHLASNLRSTAATTIETTRMEVAVKRLESRIANAEQTHAEEIQLRIARAREAFKNAMALWRTQLDERAKGQWTQYKQTCRAYSKWLKTARQEWQSVLQALKQVPEGTAGGV